MTVLSGSGTKAGHNGHRRENAAAGTAAASGGSPDPLEPLAKLFRDLRSAPGDLSGREAARRLEVTGSNPLRLEVPAAIASVHQEAIRAHVVNGLTAAAVARRVGIGAGPGGMRVVSGGELDALSEPVLDALTPGRLFTVAPTPSSSGC